MEKIDLKDRKILYHLDINSRQSFRSIGRKVGLSKDIVASRVKRLQEKGIIKGYYLDINYFKLGYTELRFYLTFQFVTPEIKSEIIDYFLKNKYINTIHSVEGHYDLVIVVILRNIAKFSNTWNKVFNKYREYFASQVYSTLFEHAEYKLTFLLSDNENKKGNRLIHKMYDEGIRSEIDELDWNIFKILNKNARTPTVEIADKLNTTSTTITNRINKLIKSGIILGFRVNIDYQKIGYIWYKADIVLKDTSKTQGIIDYIEKNPNLIYRVKSIGYRDLEFGFILENVNQLHQIIGDLSKKFPDTIKNYTYFSTTQTHIMIVGRCI
jgi:Lrp/AsnC family leucine-responsive transcriptional regulator